MRSLSLFMLGLLLAAGVSAQTSPYEVWPELEEFHTAIALTFHPAEDGDFKPVRNDSGSLLEAAENLRDSEIPDQYYSDDMVDQLDALAAECESLDALAQDETTADSDLFAALKSVHELFHGVEKLCRK